MTGRKKKNRGSSGKVKYLLPILCMLLLVLVLALSGCDEDDVSPAPDNGGTEQNGGGENNSGGGSGLGGSGDGNESHDGENTDGESNNPPAVLFTEGLEYALINNGTAYEVLSIGTATDTKIIIPDTYQGLPVTSIGTRAFYGCWKLTEVVIPDSITSIGYGSFDGCTGIMTMSVPFVGASKTRTDVTHFGYIFGASSYESNSAYVPASLKTVIVTNTTKIDTNAFQNCNELKEVILPIHASIGKSAFKDCTKLESLTISGADFRLGYIFGGSSKEDNVLCVPESLKTVVVLGGESIVENAFYGCIYLQSITIPSSVTNIEEYAFYACQSLKQVEIPNSVKRIGAYAFFDCRRMNTLTIPDGVERIGEYAFCDCRSLKTITVPDSVTSIGESAFAMCSQLESIKLPFVGGSRYSMDPYLGYVFGAESYLNNFDHMPPILKTVEITDDTDIGSGAFYGCSDLTDIIIPADTRSIGENAFYGCRSLQTITIPSSVTDIGQGAFAACSGLVDFQLASNNTVYRKEGNCLIRIEDNVLIAGCKTSTIPNGVKKIDNFAFYSCTMLTDITIPSSVTSIGISAFADCYRLTEIIIPSTVESIGKAAFEDCTELVQITIPFVGENGNTNGYFGYIFGADSYSENREHVPTSLKTVILTGGASVSSYAFFDCSSLITVVIPNSVLTIEEAAFSGCSAMENMTLPFVGGSIKTANDTYQYPFGYIFGTDSYEGGVATEQYYYGSSTSSSTYSTYYIPSTLKSVTVTGGNILYCAFYNCSGLTSITIPSSVTSIGNGAFEYCSGLTSITIPASVTRIDGYAFYNCSGLESVTFEAGSLLESIGYSAFYNCSGLTSITIPASVTSIGYRAFYNCSGLTSITIPSSVTGIDGYAFYNCSGLESVTFEAGSRLESIGYSAFYNCSGLTSITIPASVTSIGNSAFYGCSKLKSITLPFVGATLNGTENTHFGYIFGAASYSSNNAYVPTSLKTVVITGGTSIDSYAFYYCSGLTNITIPNSVTIIGSYAFYNCSGLTSITIPSSVTSITQSAFSYCSGLTGVYISDLAAWCQINFNNSEANPLYYAHKLYLNGTLVTDLVISSSVTRIGSYAFYGYSNLESVIFETGSRLESIGVCAFYGCSGLESVIFETGSRLESIGNSAFYNCSGLTSISIPNSVTSIGYRAFYGCSKLESMTLPFVGATLNGTENTHFGYIFGAYDYYSNGNYVPTSLKTVVVTGGTSIGKSAFYGCSNLESMTLPFVGGSIKTANDTYQYPFGYIFGTASYEGGVATEQYYYGSSTSSLTSSTYYIPSKLKSVTITGGNILYGAFYNCSGLTSITISEGVTSIGNYAFYNCSGLTSITILSSVTSIGEDAFDGCASVIYTEYGNGKYLGNAENQYLILVSAVNTSITEVTIHSQTAVISDYAFSYCRGLTSITIPSSVTSIGNRAFYNCSSLTSITVESGNTVYRSEGNCLIEIATNTLILGCKNSVIPIGVTSIGDAAFYGCSGLTSITIPRGVMSIGVCAFCECSGLTSITIPSSVTSIGRGAFADCNKLESVTFEEGSLLESIGEYAFNGCRSLTSITIPSGVTIIGDSAFSGCSNLVEVCNQSALSITKGSSGNGYVGYYALNVYTPTSGASKLHTQGDYVFYVDTDKIYLVGYTGTATELVLPNDYNGSNYEIYKRAFYGRTDITSVIIGNGVTSIGSDAFRFCSKLESVTFEEGSLLESIGSYAFQYCSSLTNITIPSSVTSIGEYAFSSCSKLESVTFEEGSLLESIGNRAFYDCSGLTNITIPSSVTSIDDYAFYGCSRLENVTFEAGSLLESIGILAFYDCSNLTSITIPSSVTSIGSSAFSGCYTLVEVCNQSALSITKGSSGNGYVGYYALNVYTPTSGASKLHTQGDYVFYVDTNKIYLVGYTGTATQLVLPNDYNGSNYEIYQYAFYERTDITSITIGNGVTSIGNRAFYNCSGLTSITIPSSVTSIGKYAFYNCSNLTSITIPASVKSIGDYAFYDCSGLTSVTFEAGSRLKSIGNCAFYNCRGLTSITIPSSVTSIGYGAFGGCSKLESMTLPFVGGSIKTANDTYQYPFGYIFGTDSYEGGVATNQVYYGSSTSSLTYSTYYIPSTLKSVTVTGGNILFCAFYNCSGLTSITISEGVTSIGSYAFDGCSGLTSITIPSSVTSIGSYAFYGCSGLTSITIPSSVTSIGSYAFYGCSKLGSITFADTTTWYRTTDSTIWGNKTGGTQTDVSNARTNGTYFMSTYYYYNYYWYKR